MLSFNGNQMNPSIYRIKPMVGTSYSNQPLYSALAPELSIQVSSLVFTTLSTASSIAIPVTSDGSLNQTLNVTNTGDYLAYNVHADLSTLTCTTSSSNITQTPCDTILPNESCNLVFSSTTPCLASGNVTVTGDNISNPPVTTVGFTIQGYYVFALNSPSSDDPQVIHSEDILMNPTWGANFNLTNATDGYANTMALNGLNAPAANACLDLLPENTWYSATH